MDDVLGGPHRRYDPLRDEWVLVSAGRTDRPWQGHEEPATPAVPFDPDCYLCPRSTRAGGRTNPDYDGPWVFTNDFPALRPGTSVETAGEGLFRAAGVSGTCRVVCFSPRHDHTLATLPTADVRRVIDTWATETTELGATYPWVQVFENRGAMMGASNPHPHGQIWATSSIPREGAVEERTQRDHHEATGRRLLLDVAGQETGGPRVVIDRDDWLVVVPFWAIWPFETLVIPRRPVGRLADLDDGGRDALASVLGELLRRYDGLFDAPAAYSMGWHQAPFSGSVESDSAHWQLHAHVYPPALRSATIRKFLVGYELLSEPQRDLTPEEAAERLAAVRVTP